MDSLLSSFSGFSENWDNRELYVCENRPILCGAVLDANSDKRLRNLPVLHTTFSSVLLKCSQDAENHSVNVSHLLGLMCRDFLLSLSHYSPNGKSMSQLPRTLSSALRLCHTSQTSKGPWNNWITKSVSLARRRWRTLRWSLMRFSFFLSLRSSGIYLF